MKRLYVNLTEEQAVALKERARATGTPVSIQIRQAIWNFLDLPASRVLNTVPKAVLVAQPETK